MKDNLTHIRFILDRSGSMSDIRESTIAGFNEFVKGQKNTPGECTMTLQLFDTTNPNEIVFEEKSVQEVPELTLETYVPRASTPLHDAMGQAIVSLGRKLAAMHEEFRPSKVIVCIMTDGLENSSRHYTAAQVADLIEGQRKGYKWEFLFLGANQDACMTGEALNILRANAVTYAATAHGTSAVMGMTTNKVANYRVTGQSGSLTYTDADRKEAEQE